MISPSDLIHLPYTRDLTDGGIAYALRVLPYMYNRMGGSPYDRLRRTVAGVAVELAFRRYLAEQQIPFDVKSALPFTDPNQYDVSLGGRRCDIKSFFISYREQIAEMKRNPQVVLNAPALVPSDQNVSDGNSNHDIYLFAFLSGLIAASQADLQPRWRGRFRHSHDGTHRSCPAPIAGLRFVESSSTINTPCKYDSHAVNDGLLCSARPQFFAHKE